MSSLVFINQLSGHHSDKLAPWFSGEHEQNLICNIESDMTIPSNLSSFQSIVLCGGDDTIRKVVQLLLQSHSPKDIPNIFIFPSGTVNDLCRVLDIPLNHRKALSLFHSGQHIVNVDYGIGTNLSEDEPSKQVLFFSRCSTGFLVNLQRRVFATSLPSSSFSYYKSVLPAFVSVEPVDYIIKADDAILHRRSIGIIVTNSNFMGGLKWASSDQINCGDGYLDLLIYTAESLFEKVKLLRGIFWGF
ncbi:hypothetical protein GEMRC1_009078 [Eukaryota sp. GEM-RC1]